MRGREDALSSRRPDLVKHLTPTTDDVGVRRDPMAKFRDVVAWLRVDTVHFLPVERHAALDRNDAYGPFFGSPHYALDHEGLHPSPHIGMPTWGALLFGRDVLDVVTAVTGLGTRPPAVVGAERRRLQAAGAETDDPAGTKEEP
jgi:hypothetical protein